MKKTHIYIFIVFHFVMVLNTMGQDRTSPDNSTINEFCNENIHLLELFTHEGVPVNLDINHPVEILINHGYAVGYCKNRNAPLWAAYEVVKIKGRSENDQDIIAYDRPDFFYDDMRLAEKNRISTESFRHAGPYDRGHMAPNAALRLYYGRLGQMETYVMSNIVYQKATMNQQIWQELEEKIRVEYSQDREHIWVICGPIFGDNPELVKRANKVEVAIPESFYLIIADSYYDSRIREMRTTVLPLIIPQDATGRDIKTEYITTVDDIESKTNLNFFPRLNKDEETFTEDYKPRTPW